MTVGITERRAAIVTAITGALTAAGIVDVPVTDDQPDTVAADRTIVVTWLASTHDRTQWQHTFELLVIVTNRTSAGFFAGRDQLTGIVLNTLNNLTGVSRPTAGVRTITLGAGDRAHDYELCSVVTVVATAQPTST